MGNRGPARVFSQLYDREWLEEAVSSRKNGAELAAEIGCSQPALYQAVKKHGIEWPKRGNPKLRDEGWLRAKYLDEGLGCESIAKEIGTSAQAVKDALTRIGIARRSQIEARRVRAARLWKMVEMPLARKLYDSGHTLRELGQRFGVSEHIIQQVLTAAGVKMRTKGETSRIRRADPVLGKRYHEAMQRQRRPTGVRKFQRLLKQDAICCFCEATEGIEQHHLNGVRSDHRPENLVPLCRDCHAKVEWLVHHATEGLRRAYRGEEPDLRLPA